MKHAQSIGLRVFFCRQNKDERLVVKNQGTHGRQVTIWMLSSIRYAFEKRLFYFQFLVDGVGCGWYSYIRCHGD
jgi:hypothetical protein